jgi:hypothetical protein
MVLMIDFKGMNSHQLRAFQGKILENPLEDPLKNLRDASPLILLDQDTPDNLPILEEVRHQKYTINFVVCLKIKDFYKLDFVGVLETYLQKVGYDPYLIEQIVTASQEAYSNALLWSSLDLTMDEGTRFHHFCDHLEERLKNPLYGNRFLGVYITKNTEFIEIAFFVQGRPIVWPKEQERPHFKGISIIRSHTHHFHIDENGKAIRLFF